MVTISGVGIGLYAFIGTVLTLLIGALFDTCNLVNLPPVLDAGGLTVDECYAMTAAMAKGVAKDKQPAAEMLMMFFHVVVRIEQNFFFASSIVWSL